VRDAVGTLEGDGIGANGLAAPQTSMFAGRLDVTTGSFSTSPDRFWRRRRQGPGALDEEAELSAPSLVSLAGGVEEAEFPADFAAWLDSMQRPELCAPILTSPALVQLTEWS
jgi:hypothetical protein